jgi:hypothetical protein
VYEEGAAVGLGVLSVINALWQGPHACAMCCVHSLGAENLRRSDFKKKGTRGREGGGGGGEERGQGTTQC